MKTRETRTQSEPRALAEPRSADLKDAATSTQRPVVADFSDAQKRQIEAEARKVSATRGLRR